MSQNIGGFHTRDVLSISDRLSVGCINWYQTVIRLNLKKKGSTLNFGQIIRPTLSVNFDRWTIRL